jgi:hypothetical protein
MIGTLLALTGLVDADPCGMVPPIYLGQGPPPTLERTGAQRTYVMHRQIPGVGGVETMALRPGFTGNVEDFGMLIPFPSPPAIRKIEDDTFTHLENAVDPPEMTVEIYQPMPVSRSRSGVGGMLAMKSSAAPEAEGMAALGYMDVNVVRQEAVGMYEVAVLEAGSPKALQKWMDDNGYAYPEGMDETVKDYVAASWCFVAIKAKVGGAEGATPHPGMRTADTSRPVGSPFDGHVQGMAFRFLTDTPVVPMRLSVFNGEDPRNVVYVLADEPVRIEGVKDQLVVRQIQGEELYGHLTEPIGVSWINGSAKDLSQTSLDQIDQQRDPALYNSVARDLFASDLLAARQGELALPFEDEAKELLNLSESLGLRGPEIDALMAEAVGEQQAMAVHGALDDLKEMHLSVIDGVFPQALLAAQNLSFASYTMPEARNQRRSDELMTPGPHLWYMRGQ